jgi:hypothetical protein
MGLQVDGPFEMDSRERLVLTFNMTDQLNVSDTIVPGTSELVRISDGANYPSALVGTQAVAGKFVAQQVSDLEPGERYWLIMVFSTAAGEIFAPHLQLTCPKP